MVLLKVVLFMYHVFLFVNTLVLEAKRDMLSKNLRHICTKVASTMIHTSLEHIVHRSDATLSCQQNPSVRGKKIFAGSRRLKESRRNKRKVELHIFI